MKQKRTNYADERRGAQENSLAPGDQVLVKQRKENKLSTTFEDAPYSLQFIILATISYTSRNKKKYIHKLIEAARALQGHQ